MLQIFILDLGLFWPILTKKQPKKQPKKYWQNPNRMMKFSEIWYVDASQQNKMLHKKLFLDFGNFGRFLTKKQQKKRKKKLPKSKPFNEIF